MGQLVNYSKRGQMKMQEMAFVLIAIVILFGLVAMIFLSIWTRHIRDSVQKGNEDKARELVMKLASTAEFSFSIRACSTCVDMDKVLVLKDFNKTYSGFWGLGYLQIERVYPKGVEGECNKANYPNCKTITLVDSKEYETPAQAYVSLCKWTEAADSGYYKCELGRIYAGEVKLND
jgi:hypothetical protein